MEVTLKFCSKRPKNKGMGSCRKYKELVKTRIYHIKVTMKPCFSVNICWAGICMHPVKYFVKICYAIRALQHICAGMNFNNCTVWIKSVVSVAKMFINNNITFLLLLLQLHFLFLLGSSSLAKTNKQKKTPYPIRISCAPFSFRS